MKATIDGKEQVSVIVDSSSTITVVQPIGSNLHVVLDTSNVNVVNPVSISGQVHVLLDTSNVNIVNFPATQVVSGTVTVIQPTGSNLHAVLDTSNVNVTNSITVVQPIGSNLHVVQDNSNVYVISRVLTPSAPASGTVNVTSAVLVAANPNRTGLTLINLTSKNVSLAFGFPAVLNSGITLLNLGSSWTMDESDFTTSAVSAIASANGATIAIQEYS